MLRIEHVIQQRVSVPKLLTEASQLEQSLPLSAARAWFLGLLQQPLMQTFGVKPL